MKRKNYHIPIGIGFLKLIVFWVLLMLVTMHSFAQGTIIPANGSYGLYTETAANQTAGNSIPDTTIGLYVWEHTLDNVSGVTPYEGSNVLTFQQAQGATWFGFGIAALKKYNLAAFGCGGYLSFNIKTTATQPFEIRMESPGRTAAFPFEFGADPFGFVRDGNWHTVNIPLADFVAKGLDISNVTQLFIFGGGNVGMGTVSFDNIYFGGGKNFTDPCLAQKLTTIGFGAPDDILRNTPVNVQAIGYNQYNVPMSGVSFNYSVNNGASIDASGNLLAPALNLYQVTATATNSAGVQILGMKVFAAHNQIPKDTRIPFNGSYGIAAESPTSMTAGKLWLGGEDATASLYVWSNTMIATDNTPSEGANVISFKGAGVGWMGMGIHSRAPINLSAFTCSDGALQLDIKTSQPNNFLIRMGNETGKIAEVAFNNGADPYGFVRDGNWNTVTIPLSAFAGVDFKNVTELFQFTSVTDMVGSIAFDNIHLINGHDWSDPCLNGKLSSIEVRSSDYTTNITTGQPLKLTAAGFNQYNAPVNGLSFNWSVDNGASISQSGLFSASAPGLYKVAVTAVNQEGVTVRGERSIAVYNTLPQMSAVPTSGNYGIFAEDPAKNTAGKLIISKTTAGVFVWEGTMRSATSTASEGTDVIAYQSGGKGWLGMGIHLEQPMNISAFTCADGALHFDMKTDQTNNFTIRLGNASDFIAEIPFKNGSDPYGFVRDGQWHGIDIPLKDFVGADLTIVNEIFQYLSASDITGTIAFDNIYLKNGHAWSDPCLDAKLSIINVAVQNNTTDLVVGQTANLSAAGFTKYGLAEPVNQFTWSVNNGGTITPSGQFTASAPGFYTITASAPDKNGQIVKGTRSIAVYNTLPQSQAVPTAGNYGIFVENPASNTAGKAAMGTNAHVYVWENTMKGTTTDASEGSNVIAYRSGGKGWLGMGIHLDTAMNLYAFTCADGALHFDMKTDQTNNFTIRLGNQDGFIAAIPFNNGTDPYGFVRDGKWHSLDIPLKDFVGADLSKVTELLQYTSSTDIKGIIAFDNIYLKNGHAWSDPCLDGKLNVVNVKAPRYKIINGQSIQLTAEALSQYKVAYPNAKFTWSVNNGGSITQNGLFTASVNQSYTVTATTSNEYGQSVSGSTNIVVTNSIPAYVDGRYIYVNNGQRYIIKGVAYSPVDVGQTSIKFTPAMVNKDIALMKEAGINTIRTYTPIQDGWVLDAFAAAGIKIIMGFTSSSGGPDIASGKYLDYINQYKNHPAILMWDLGNEYNYHPEWFGGNIDNWYTMLNKAAAAIHVADPDHPVSTTHGELPAPAVYAKVPNVDVWGMNVYRSDNSHTAVLDFAARYDKPSYLAETGGDSYNSNPNLPTYAFGENQQMQADADRKIIEKTLSNLDAGNGIAIFEFTDEWQKSGSPWTQDPGGFAPNSGGVPYDGAPNEEYWGIVDVYRNKKLVFDEVKRLYNGNVCLVNAKAGANQSLAFGATSTSLKGAASIYPLAGGTYLWTQVSGPITANIISPTSLETQVTGMTGGTYTFRLSVTAGCGSATGDVKVIVESAANRAPVANAGSNQSLAANVTTTTLNGSGTDPDNGPSPLTYRWTQTSGSAVTLVSPTSASTAVNGLTSGKSYAFSLVVFDGVDYSQASVVSVNVGQANAAPIANPGSNQVLASGTTTASLNGSGSADPDKGPSALTYRWTQVSGPTATLSSTTVASPTVSGLANGNTYVFSLVVYDGADYSSAAQVLIEVGKEVANGCSFSAPNGDYTASISNTVNPTITFVPGAPLQGGSWVNLAAFVNGNIIGAWSMTKTGANFTSTINVAAGTELDFYFTYGVPGGNQRDNGAKMHHVRVASCTGGSINVTPNANAGTNKIFAAGITSVVLNGSGSSDPDNGPSPLTYSWSQVSGPAATISNTTIASPTVSGLTNGGKYVFALVVYDGADYSAGAQVAVEVASDVISACSFAAANGDYTASITNTANPTITFVPGAPLQGGSWVNLAAFVNGNIIGAWSMNKTGANFTQTLNLTAGTQVEFYFTYGVPSGGQRDNNANRHQTIVAGCGNARVAVSNTRVSDAVSKTRVSDNSTISVISVYPNPISSGVLYIDLGFTTDNVEVMLMDEFGRNVRGISATHGNAVQVLQLPVEGIIPGLYLLKIMDAHGIPKIQKVVVN